MSEVARVGDVCGGDIVSGSDTVYVNGIPVAKVGDAIAPHGNGEHASAVIISGSDTVYVNGIPVAKVGETGSCGDVISTGSPNVLIGD